MATSAHSKWLEEFKKQYVRSLLQEMKKRDKGLHSRQIAIKGLLAITKRSSKNDWHQRSDIQMETDFGVVKGGFVFTPGSNSDFQQGLDAWLEAGVILREKKESRYRYRISEPFLAAVSEAVSDLSNIASTTI